MDLLEDRLVVLDSPCCGASFDSSLGGCGWLEQNREVAASFPALEGLTRSAWTVSPRKVGWNKFRRGAATAATQGGGGGGDIRERRGAAAEA
ncbi:hypothetical protein F511_23124 [Dorcoceras hygrometricum]|uniref:Uncharacterized protein n=1 Tax=Dorcoceras hygrometricum TaxID=472368 RepID=A0A2Z7AC94_9LAMI|nr:hypothetical protein F511_23124 [Dorcoceras hygrometricum]